MNFYSFFLFAILSIALVAGNDVKRPAGHVDRHGGHAPDGDHHRIKRDFPGRKQGNPPKFNRERLEKRVH
ncbi:unnamed protein product [Caenorhabditis sp. 36 PRJEB53466]|nr:unnamed protein product [Caenorhabditis sp. 36 PRJEB53466]